MRTSLLVFLVAACTREPSFDDAIELDGELPGEAGSPPPPPFLLAADNFIAGSPATLYVTGAPPNEFLRVMGGFGGLGAGPCPALLGGPCLGIARPVRLLIWGILTDDEGNGTLSLRVPDHHVGRVGSFHVALEGAPGSLSNLVSRFIGPVGAVVWDGVDADGDGFAPPEDCADFRADVHPGATDPIGDGRDWSCDDLDGEDDDGDWLESVESGGTDCDDNNPAIGDKPEICDGLDNDCDGVIDPVAPGPTCAPVSCKAIDAGSLFTASSGVYTIDPDGGDDSNAFDVYCDMDTDGGGWTRVVNIRGTTNQHGNTTGAYGDVSVDTMPAKLSDTMINQLNTVGYWRYQCSSFHANVKNDANQWVSQLINTQNWSIDRDRNGVYECPGANRDGYTFSDYLPCMVGHSNYAATSPAEGNGCAVQGLAWNLNGAVWAK